MNMPKILFLFLALLLNCITNLQTSLNSDQTEAIEIQIDSQVEFGRDKNYFKFNYYGSNEAKIGFYFEPEGNKIYLKDPENGKYELGAYNYRLFGNLTYNGTYYLEVICQSISCELGGKFYSTIIGNIETIDFSDNLYYQVIQYERINYLGLKTFKVSNLKEEKLVYFSTYGLEDNYLEYWYPFYQGEDPPFKPNSNEGDFSNLTIFEIFNVNNQTSERNVRLYKFEPNKEYIIYIHCLKYYYTSSNEYYYVRYLFFPLTNSHIKIFTGEENFIFPEGPMFGIVNSNMQKDFEIKTENFKHYVKTNETIENNLQILSSLKFSYPYGDVKIKKGEAKNTIILFVPKNFQNRAIYFIDEFFYVYKLTTFTVPAHKSMYIYPKFYEYYDIDYVFTFKSEFKNMRIIDSNVNEDTDYIIQNYMELDIFIGRTERDCTITITQYIPKFARFGAENSYLFNTLF